MLMMIARSARQLGRRPLSSVLVVLILAIGIGANIAFFVLFDDLFLHPLPFTAPEELVAIQASAQLAPSDLSWQDVKDIEANQDVFIGVSGYSSRTFGLSDNIGSPPLVIESGIVTPNFFHTLGVLPLFADMPSGALTEHSAIISYALWQSRYHARHDVVGSALYLNEISYRIVGVLPNRFTFPVDGQIADIYIVADQSMCCSRDQRIFEAVGRLRAGTPTSRATQFLTIRTAQLVSTYGDTNKGLSFWAKPLDQVMWGSRKWTVLLLWGSVSALTLIAILNAGSIIVAQALRNLRALAIKASLGIDLKHLILEHASEGLVFGIGSGLVGTIFGAALLKLILISPSFAGLVRPSHATDSIFTLLDWRVILFCVIISFSSSVLASIFPLVALRTSRLAHYVQVAGAISVPRTGRQLRSGLLAGQIILSVALVMMSAVLAKAIRHIYTEDPGFSAANIVMAGVGVPESRYDSDEKVIRFHQEVMRKIDAVPGVEQASVVLGIPTNSLRTRFFLEGQNIPVKDRPKARLGIASPQTFALLQIPLVQGREFSNSDVLPTHQPVAIVNQSFVTRYMTGRNPLTSSLSIGFYNGTMIGPWSTYSIVGVVGDIRNVDLQHTSEPEIFLSALQIPLEGANYLIKTQRPASSLRNELIQSVWSVDPNLQAVEPRPLMEFVDSSFATQRTMLALLGGFGIVALFLTSLGLGSTMSAAVTESTREIGIRMALGESKIQIVCRLVRYSTTLIITSLLAGVAFGVAIVRVSQSLLMSSAQFDLLSVSVTVILVACVSFVSVLVPSLYATKISPMEALRHT
jgi:putative ABC transport system permease protein